MLILITIIVILLIISLFMMFPEISPIPHSPTHVKDFPLLLEAFELKNDQILFNLGAGNGRTMFKAAKEAHMKGLNTKFIAVEINPLLVTKLHVRKFFNPNSKNITIIFGDMFKVNYASFIPDPKTELVFYLYISPLILEKTASLIKPLHYNKTIVSYYSSIPSLKDQEEVIQGIRRIYKYKFRLLNYTPLDQTKLPPKKSILFEVS